MTEAAENQPEPAERVKVQYDVEINGEERSINLPFVVGVLADLSGDRPPLDDREFLEAGPDSAAAHPGLRFLLERAGIGDDLKVKVWDVSRDELVAMAREENLFRTPLFRKVYEDTYGRTGGEPFACLVADFAFDHSEEDVALLRYLGRVGAAAHAPVLADAGASLLGLASWRDLPKVVSVPAILGDEEHAAWNSLRDADDACYVGLSMPRVLSELPDGADLETDRDEPAAQSAEWFGSAFAVAANIARSFREHGWFARTQGVELGGAIDELPSKVMPTEVDIPERYESELSGSGIQTFCHWKGKDRAIFFSSPSLRRPADSSGAANRAASLNYRLAAGRFVHYLKCVVRDKIGRFKSLDTMNQWLNAWIDQYVEKDLDAILDGGTPGKPIAEGRVELSDSEEWEGVCKAVVTIQPCYQYIDSSITLTLTTYLPGART